MTDYNEARWHQMQAQINKQINELMGVVEGYLHDQLSEGEVRAALRDMGATWNHFQDACDYAIESWEKGATE